MVLNPVSSVKQNKAKPNKKVENIFYRITVICIQKEIKVMYGLEKRIKREREVLLDEKPNKRI